MQIERKENPSIEKERKEEKEEKFIRIFAEAAATVLEREELHVLAEHLLILAKTERQGGQPKKP